MNTFVQLTESEFEAQYPLIQNHRKSNASWNGCMFETFGPEHEFVVQQDPRTIWTLVDDGVGGECIISGYHFVNRLGYFISTVPVPEGTDIEVSWPRERDDEDE